MDISAVLTCHNEGFLLGPALASFEAAVMHCKNQGIDVERIVVMDRADELTKSIIYSLGRDHYTILETDLGDPGQARNAAVQAATGDFISFLDGDDLWSFNWLTEAWSYTSSDENPAILHSEVNVVFGSVKQIWWHVDSAQEYFDHDYLKIGNYWDAMCFSPRKILQIYPFRANALKSGFGHEDWHWNCVTLSNGIPHRPVPGTVHFKRRRKGSQMAKCHEQDVVAYETVMARFTDRAVAQEISSMAFE